MNKLKINLAKTSFFDYDSEGLDQRLKVINLIVWFEGRISRALVMTLFNVGESRASVLIREYRALFPESYLAWDTKDKSFHKTEEYVKFVEGSCSFEEIEKNFEYYQQVKGQKNSVLPGVSFFDPGLFSILSQYIEKGENEFLEAEYYVGRLDLIQTVFFKPVTLVKVGLGKWFLRCYCLDSGGGFSEGFYNLKLDSFRGELPQSHVAIGSTIPTDDLFLKTKAVDLKFGGAEKVVNVNEAILKVFLVENGISLLPAEDKVQAVGFQEDFIDQLNDQSAYL